MSLVEPLSIRYDGGWAEEHRLPLSTFARSADGLDDILGFCAEFAITQQIIIRRPARSVRLVISTPEPACFEFMPTIEAVSQHPLIVSASSGLFAALTALVFSKLANRGEQQRHHELVRGLLEELGYQREHSRELLSALFGKLEKKRPAAARSVSPIGAGCREMTLGAHTESELILSPKDRELIELGPAAEIVVRSAVVKISELDRVTGGCRVSFPDDEPRKRYRGAVLDPSVRVDGNIYGAALNSGETLKVDAEISIVEGEIRKVIVFGPSEGE